MARIRRKLPTSAELARYGRKIRTWEDGERHGSCLAGVQREANQISGVPLPARDVLDRVTRLACRTVGAREVVLLVRDELDPHRLLPVARSGSDSDLPL